MVVQGESVIRLFPLYPVGDGGLRMFAAVFQILRFRRYICHYRLFGNIFEAPGSQEGIYPVWMTLMVLYQIGFYQSAEYMGYHFYNRYYPYYSVLNPQLSPEREAIIYSENNKWIYYNYN